MNNGETKQNRVIAIEITLLLLCFDFGTLVLAAFRGVFLFMSFYANSVASRNTLKRPEF